MSLQLSWGNQLVSRSYFYIYLCVVSLYKILVCMYVCIYIYMYIYIYLHIYIYNILLVCYMLIRPIYLLYSFFYKKRIYYFTYTS